MNVTVNGHVYSVNSEAEIRALCSSLQSQAA